MKKEIKIILAPLHELWQNNKKLINIEASVKGKKYFEKLITGMPENQTSKQSKI